MYPEPSPRGQPDRGWGEDLGGTGQCAILVDTSRLLAQTQPVMCDFSEPHFPFHRAFQRLKMGGYIRSGGSSCLPCWAGALVARPKETGGGGMSRDQADQAQ